MLFGNQQNFCDGLLEGLAAAPDGPPLLMLFHAYQASFPLLTGNRPFAEQRFGVIAATPALQEREAAKLASVNRTLAAALVARGADERLASLATEVGMAALAQATRAWVAEPPPGDLERHLRRAFADLQVLTDNLVLPRGSRARRSA